MCMCMCASMCVCTHKCLCFVCVWVWSNYLHQPGVVLIMCNFLKTDWALVIIMALMVSLSKEFDKHYISWDWSGGVGCPQPFPCLPQCIQVLISSTQVSQATKMSLFSCSPSLMLACISGPSWAYGCILAGQFMLVSSLIFNLALWEKFCFPSVCFWTVY